MDMHEEIKKVAYELYEKSGRIGGREVENWLAAERIVMARRAQGERAGAPAARSVSQKTALKAKTKDAGPKGIEAGKAAAPKKASKKTTKRK